MPQVAVIGGGSTYTLELVNGILARVDQLPFNELWLMDINKVHLDAGGKFVQRMMKSTTKHKINYKEVNGERLCQIVHLSNSITLFGGEYEKKTV